MSIDRSMSETDSKKIMSEPRAKARKKPSQKKDHPNKNGAATLAIFGPQSPMVKLFMSAPKLTRSRNCICNEYL